MTSNFYHKKMNYFRLYVLELEQEKNYVGLIISQNPMEKEDGTKY